MSTFMSAEERILMATLELVSESIWKMTNACQILLDNNEMVLYSQSIDSFAQLIKFRDCLVQAINFPHDGLSFNERFPTS